MNRAILRRSAEQDVRLNTDLAQFLDRVLGRLGLQFARGWDIGQQRQVDEAGTVAPFFDAHLTDGLEEGQRLDVAHRTTDLDNGHLGIARTLTDVQFDLIRDVRDDLDGLAEVFASAFLLDHRLVDLAGGEVVALGHPGPAEALVVAQVEVGLGTVLSDEDLAVLKGTHSAWIDVDVRIQLHEGDLDAT